MKRNVLTVLLLLLLCTTLSAAYTGRVFIDKNNNNVFDSGEKPLSGIMVSDGLNVVKTEKDGRFTLPGHEKERFIFITTPSGYKTDNRHYIRIDKSTASYDFGLQPYNAGIRKDGSHSYIQITDTEIFNTQGHEDWINNLRNYAANEEVAFIMHTGDICYENGLKEHIRLMNTTNMNRPVFYSIGNHDLVKGEYGEQLFESIYGPVFYSFDFGNVHYLVTPMLGGDYKPSYTKADVYKWLKNDLAQIKPGTPVMVFSHDLLTYADEFIYGINDTEKVDLNQYNLKSWVYGHWHINFMRKQGDVYTVCTSTLDKGGIDHSTSAYRVMHVGGNGSLTSELRYTYNDKTLRITSPTADGLPLNANGSVPLLVNTYSSNMATSQVRYTCTVDGKTRYTNRPLKQATDWTWQAEIPLTPKDAGKTVQCRVTTQFSNGETAETEVNFVYPTQKPEIKLSGSWTNLLGNPEHNGIVSDTLKTPLQLAWASNVGANIYMTSPLIADGKVFTASVDENLRGEAHVYALDATTGKLLWKYRVRNSIKNTIAIEAGLVFAQDAEGYLYAIDTKSGTLKWEKKLPLAGLPALIEGLVTCNGVVYAGAGHGLCAFKATNGEMLWQNKSWRQGEGTTSTLSAGSHVLVGGAQWKGLYGNNIQTGELLWEAGSNGLRNRGASAVLHGNLLYIISEKSFFIMDALKGTVIARREFPFSVDVTSTPLLTDKEIIFGTVDAGMTAIDKETFDIRWQFKPGSALIYTAPYTRKPSATIETSPVLSGTTVFFGASDGTLYGVNKTDGSLVWKHETGAPVFSTVAISGNTLFASDFGGNIYAFTCSLF